ncbi:MAG: hypothetical protein HHJ15_13845 [Rhodoferax sp.]|nr:hypothetical protein [Rhodoferax sp.]
MTVAPWKISCCEAMTQAISNGTSLATVEQTCFDMFIAEWRVLRIEQPRRYSVIVDDDP